jgi:hypothetical protein
MTRTKGKRKPPSRKRYEAEHPAITFRLDRATHDCLKEHLEGTGFSFADFIKGALGKERSMVEKRVKVLAAREADPSVEDRLRCLEDLVHQLFSLADSTHGWPPLCPHCDNQELIWAEGKQMESKSTLALAWAHTWRCPKCGFFLNTSKRIDARTIVELDRSIGKSTSKSNSGEKRPKTQR